MPGFDGTGPIGMGPMTGGGRGFCAVPMKDWGGPYSGREFGRGRGRGWRNCYWATGMPGWMQANQPQVEEENLDMLKSYAGNIRQELANIEERIETLKKSNGEDK